MFRPTSSPFLRFSVFGRCLRNLRSLSLAALVCLVPRIADAHAVGTSRGEYALHGRTISVSLLFARPELVSVVPSLDADRDGLVSDRELAAARPALIDAIVQQITMDTGAERCSGMLDDLTLVEGDGLLIRATYRCATSPAALTASLGFLDVLAHGHRHFAATGAEDSAPTITYSGHAQLALTTHGGTWMVSAGQAGEIFRLGLLRVVTGYDYLVFLMALLVVGGRARTRLLTLAAFTTGQWLALGVSAASGLSPSMRFVAPAIALAVAYVAVENWFVADADGRWLVTFPFGLAYGFSFADALRRIPLAPSQMPAAIVTFVSGIEAAQLVVVGLAVVCLDQIRRHERFAAPLVRASSAAIAAAGIWWFVSRVG